MVTTNNIPFTCIVWVEAKISKSGQTFEYKNRKIFLNLGELTL